MVCEKIMKKFLIFVLSFVSFVFIFIGCSRKSPTEQNLDVTENVEIAKVSFSSYYGEYINDLDYGNSFYLNITLDIQENFFNFVYSIQVNEDIYFYYDEVFTESINKEKSSVLVKLRLEYDGETDFYDIKSIIVANKSVKYFKAGYSSSYEPFEVPIRVGDGSVNNPYLINDVASFLQMSNYPAGTYFIQTCDLDLSTVDYGDKNQVGIQTPLDKWKPIGSKENPFQCNLDGNGYKIKNLSIQRFDNKYENGYVGLFGYVKNSIFKNIILENHRVEVRYALATGTLAGYADNCIFANCDVIQGKKENFESGNWSFCNIGGLIGKTSECTVADCNVKTDIGLYAENMSDVVNDGFLGGIVAVFESGMLINCSFSGSMESGKVAGGIIGRSDQATVTYCESDAYVMSSYIAGGIVGQLWRSDLTFSEFSGKISYSTNQGLPVYFYGYFGGIVGDAGVSYDYYSEFVDEEIESIITACRFSGDITKDGAYSQYSMSNVGAICARAYDCFISDIEINSVSLSGNYVSALVAEQCCFDFFVSNSIVSDIIGDNLAFIGIDFSSYDKSSVYIMADVVIDEFSPLNHVTDWNNIYDELIIVFDTDLWELDEGCPYLIQAGTIDGDIYDVFEESFPIM